MASIGTVEGTLKLRDQFTGVLTRASSQLQQTGRKMQRAGEQMSSAGGKLTTAITLPAVALGTGAVRAFSDFDDAMTQSLAIMGDVSDALENEMAGAARQVAKETVFSAKEAAESYFFLASAGLDAAQSIGAMPQVASFAQAGMFDMARATDLLTDAQSALGLTVEDTAENTRNMARVSDVLVRANTLANASVEQFSTALTSKAGAAIKTFNKDLEEGVAVLAAFADQGVKAELAGNALDRIMRLLPSAALKNAEAYLEFGVQVFDATGRMRNLADILGDLEDALAGMSDQQKQATLEALGFEARIQGMIKPLLGTSDAIREYEKELRDAAGTTQEVADKQLESFKNQMKLARDQITDAAIDLGETLAPVVLDFTQNSLVPLIQKLGTLGQKFGELTPMTQKVIAAFGALVVAAGPVLFIAGQLISAWGTLATASPALAAALGSIVSPIGLVVAALAGLGLAAHEAISRWRRESEEGIAAIIAANNRAKQSIQQLRQELETGVVSGRTFERIANEAFALETAIERTEQRITDLKGQMSKAGLGEMQDLRDEIEEQEEQLSNLRSEYVVVQKALKDVGKATVDWSEDTEAGSEAADGLAEAIGGMSDAAKEAMKSLKAQEKEAQALLNAMLESHEAYEVLATLLEAGVPLNEALSGAYDAQALAVVKLNKALADLEANRERQKDLAKQLAENEKELEEAINETLDAVQREIEDRHRGPLDQDNPFDFDLSAISPVLDAVKQVRAEEERRKTILQEINILLEQGAITQEEAAAAAKKLGVETEKRTEGIAESWERIGNIMANAIGEHNSELAKTISLLTQMVAMWQQMRNAANATAAQGAAMGAAFGSMVGATGIFGSPSGTSQFGGATEGTHGQAGASIGGAIGGAIGTAILPGLGTAIGAAIGSLIGGALGGLMKQGADEARFEIIAAAEDATISFKALEGGLADAGVKIAKAFRDAVESALDLIDGEILGGPNIDVKIRGDLIKVWVGGFKGVFKEVEDAIGFAVTALLRQAELGGISPEVRATLENTTARTWEELEKELAVALRSRDIKLGEARASIRRSVEDFFELFQDEFEQGIISATGTSAGLIGMVGMFEQNFNRLMGITEDAGEVARRQAEAHNAELKLAIAKLKVTKAQMEADTAQMKAEIALIEGLDAETKAALAAAQAHGAFGKVLLAGTHSAIAQAEAQAELIQAQLDAIAAIDEALASLEGLEVDVDAAMAAARRAANAGQSPLEQARQTMDQIERSLLTPFARQFEELRIKYAELEKQVGGNVEALDRLNRLREEEERALRRQVAERFQSFLGIGDDPFSELRDQWEEARQAVEDAGFGAERTARMLGRLDAALQDQLDTLSREQFVSIGDDLFGLLDRFYGNVEGFEDFRIQLERMRFELQLANLRAQFEVLKAQGTLTDAVLQQIQDVFDFIDANPVDWEKFVFPDRSAVRGVANATRDANRGLEEMARRLGSAKEGIRRFLGDLQTGAFGGRSNREAFQAAFSQFQELAAQPTNIQALEQFPEVARRLLELARERFGSTARFQEILAMVEGTGIDFLGVEQVREDNVVFDQRFFEAQRTQLETDRRGYARLADISDRGFTALSGDLGRSVQELRELRREVTEIRGEVRQMRQDEERRVS